jgi:geranylgeranyl transferase type-2 subunit beta
MLQVARLSPRPLGDARDLVQRFLLDQRHPDGGFQDRAGASDLYYTVFGLEGLLALQADTSLPVDDTIDYLHRFGDGESLDFVHLACLARAWATMAREAHAPDRVLADDVREAIATRLETFRSADGGYAQTPGAARGTIYAAFLALGAYQDLRREMPDARGVLTSIASLRARDGGFANHPDAAVGLTTSTAAAVAIHRQLGDAIAGDPGAWLLARHHAQGGFTASPTTPMPDLLSTATALHALASLHVSIAAIKESCLDFLDTLWTNRGGFYGHWADDHVDCEYTYYGLLALGHLAL